MDSTFLRMHLAFVSHDFDLDGALGFGFLAGIFLFFKGFRVYREYRILSDTPEEPIRSIPMGLVHIHGKAKGEQIVNSPITSTPCFFYKVDIEAYKTDSRGRGSWSHAATDADGVQFYLEDNTGRVLVDARRAEYDLIQSGRRETGGAFTKGFGKLLSGMDDPTLATGNRPTDSSLAAYAVSTIAQKHGGAFSENLAANLAKGSLNIFGSGTSSSGRYRLTEYCILPEHWYDLTGTCVENPKPKDEHDRNMILKGQNEPTFLISWRSEKEIEGTLRKRAALNVFGGAALSLGCLAVLLARFGWF